MTEISQNAKNFLEAYKKLVDAAKLEDIKGGGRFTEEQRKNLHLFVDSFIDWSNSNPSKAESDQVLSTFTELIVSVFSKNLKVKV